MEITTMKYGKSGQKLRLEVIKALRLNKMFGGTESSAQTIGRIQAIMWIEDEDVKGEN